MQWLSIEFSGKLQVRGKESWSAAAAVVTVFFCLLHFKLLPVYGGGSICGVYGGGSTATTTTAMMGTDATTTQSLGTHWRATAVLLLLKCELTESVLIEKAAAAVASIEGAVPSFFLLTDYHDAVAITIFSERLLAE